MQSYVQYKQLWHTVCNLTLRIYFLIKVWKKSIFSKKIHVGIFVFVALRNNFLENNTKEKENWFNCLRDLDNCIKQINNTHNKKIKQMCKKNIKVSWNIIIFIQNSLVSQFLYAKICVAVYF